MGDTIKSLLIFSAGAAIGVAVSWKYLKTKYQKIAQEEIDSVKETFANRKEKLDNLEKSLNTKEELLNKKETQDYSKLVRDLGYTNKEEKEDENVKKPYVIPPDKFGDYYEYETESLTYYEDGIVADDMGNVLTDEEVEDLIGKESLDHFGEYEDDSVFVRNEERQTDYEILADIRRYGDIEKDDDGDE